MSLRRILGLGLLVVMWLASGDARVTATTLEIFRPVPGIGAAIPAVAATGIPDFAASPIASSISVLLSAGLPSALSQNSPVLPPFSVGPTPRLSPFVRLPIRELQAALPVYGRVAQANVLTVHDGRDNRRAPVPAPIYANGIYVRDAFYTVMGLGDWDLIEESLRWFETTQDPVSGQIPTAVAFDPADTSLEPQDDESTLLFLIWAALVYREGRAVDEQVVARAWSFVRSRVVNDSYWSPPGRFRYWADCWQPVDPDVLTYNQGYYALATRLLWETELGTDLPGLSAQTVSDAAQAYRDLYTGELGFLPMTGHNAGSTFQDAAALLPEFFHRYLLGEGMLAAEVILATVDHQLATATVRDDAGVALGMKNLAQADGGFLDPGYFDCPTLRAQGNYHNGGYWPMYSMVQLALAASIQPRAAYIDTLTTLILREVESGTTHEYWELIPGHEGTVQPGRSDYSWNVLIVPALRWAGLVE